MKNAIDIARSKIGQTEASNNNDGAVVKWCMDGTEGLPWCAGFVTQPFMDAGQDGWLKGLGTARYNVDAVMDQGKKKGLNTDMSQQMPDEGSLVSFRAWGHIGMVTKVEVKEGKKFYHITHGNSSRGVANDVVPESQMKEKFFSEYVDSRKIDAYNQKENPNTPPVIHSNTADTTKKQPDALVKVFGGLPTQQQVEQQVQNNTTMATYQNHMGQMPQPLQQLGLSGMFGQILVAMLLVAAGSQGQIPSQATYQQNPDAGVDALQRVDAARTRNNGQFVREPAPTYRLPDRDPSSLPSVPSQSQGGVSVPLSAGLSAAPLPTPQQAAKTPTLMRG